MRNLLVFVGLLAAACASASDPGHNLDITMARPTAYPNWATNVNYAGGPDVGTVTKLAPSAGRMADGWRNGDPPPAQEQNYEMGLINDWIQWIDGGSALADLATCSAFNTNVIGGQTRVDVGNYGMYLYLTNAPFGTPGSLDGLWELEGVGAGNEHWKHGMLSLVNHSWTGHGLAAVGPVPGDLYPTATDIGRINPSLVPFGLFTSAAIPAAQFTTTDATNVSNTTGHVFDTITIGSLLAGDYVFAHLSATALNSGGNFQVGTYFSFDNGANYTIASPDSGGGSAFTYAQTAAGVAVAVAVNFVTNVTSTGICKVQFRGSAAAGTTTFTRSRGFIEVKRF